jgi:hypothetical protein
MFNLVILQLHLDSLVLCLTERLVHSHALYLLTAHVLQKQSELPSSKNFSTDLVIPEVMHAAARCFSFAS